MYYGLVYLEDENLEVRISTGYETMKNLLKSLISSKWWSATSESNKKMDLTVLSSDTLPDYIDFKLVKEDGFNNVSLDSLIKITDSSTQYLDKEFYSLVLETELEKLIQELEFSNKYLEQALVEPALFSWF